MLSKLKTLFNPAAQTDNRTETENIQLAVAGLLIEAAASDEDFDAAEYDTIGKILSRHFDIDAALAAKLIDDAKIDQENSDHILHLTRSIKDNFELEDRIEIMEMLWEVSYADGVIDRYESNLIRRVAGLIYVSDKDSGIARQNVLQRMRQDG